MSTKLKFWLVAAGFIVFMWVLSPDPADNTVQYPAGTTTAAPNSASLSTGAAPTMTQQNGKAADLTLLPSPMYADEAFQQLIDSGALPQFKGVKLGEQKRDIAALSAPPPQSNDTSTQPATFRTQTVRFQIKDGALPLIVGIADTPELQARGMMHYRQWPAKMHGLLFLLGREELFSMWMKNTYIPLDMVFMNNTGEVVHVVENTATLSESPIPSQKPASMVLEIPAFAAKKWNIAVGDKLLLTTAK
jgi:uncharacterized membrane protein (UPF0127 family)